MDVKSFITLVPAITIDGFCVLILYDGTLESSRPWTGWGMDKCLQPKWCLHLGKNLVKLGFLNAKYTIWGH